MTANGVTPPAPLVPLDDVVWRIDSKAYESSKAETGFVARYVPYVNAPIVARLLDEWVGPDRWFDTYQDGTAAGRPVLFCHLTVKFGDDWVTKVDVGVPPSDRGRSGGDGMTEKGTISDSFKRAACLKWGIARNVYTLPSLWAPVHSTEGKPPRAPDGIEANLVEQLKRRGFTDATVKMGEHED